MKKCELCNKVARMYCESDEASLCWSCDSRVHTANFLVAKHTRTLLCHACQSPTPWTGCGPKLGPTVSVCEACATNGTVEDDDEDEDDDNGDHAHQNDDESENQVVPLSLPPSFALTSSSSNDSSRTRDDGLSISRPTTYDLTERVEGKKGAKKMRSWMWR